MTTTNRGFHKSPKHRELSQNSTKQSPEKEHTQTTNLTRFGLNAYVLGAIRESFNCYGRRLQWLPASLNARELQPFLLKDLLQDINPRKQ